MLNKIINIIIYILILSLIILIEQFILTYPFNKKIEEIIEKSYKIQFTEIQENNPIELQLEARKKSEAEAEQRKKSEAEAEQRKKSEAEAEQRKKSEAEAEQRAFLSGLRDGYINDLRIEIERNKSYPLISKAKKEEGIVVLFFRVNNKGEISNLKILKSSGYEKLDEAALKAVKAVGIYKRIPEELENEYLDIQVPIKFNLN